MISLGNWSDKDQLISLEIDWKRLAMDPGSVKIEIPEIDDLQISGIADVKKLNIPASKGLILIISE